MEEESREVVDDESLGFLAVRHRSIDSNLSWVHYSGHKYLDFRETYYLVSGGSNDLLDSNFPNVSFGSTILLEKKTSLFLL